MSRIQTLAHKLGTSFDRGLKSISDRDLLTRFLDFHDEAAFEELVTRHLPAVRAVCRSLLRDPNDADDATQATFLVFVRRASVVRNRQALGAWLCRVAWRTATRLRVANERRIEKLVPRMEPDSIPSTFRFSDSNEVHNTVQEEISKLPEKYRIAVLACYAAGVSTADAANHLGWPKGTLLTRLAWARKRLQSRLAKRGVTLSGSIASVLAGQASSAVDAILICQITSAGLAMALGDPIAKYLVSDRVTKLMEGTVRTMLVTKMRLVLGIGFLAATLLGLGLGRFTLGSADAAPGDKKAPTPNAPLMVAENGLSPSKNPRPQSDTEIAKVEPANPGQGNDLVIRRPLGSFTREIPLFGKATVTFTEDRIHLQATVRIEKESFTVTADADYTMNRESVVYGIITGVDLNGVSEDSIELAAIVGGMHDIPFAFRLRVDDDAIVVKDIKCGPLGSPLFGQLLGGEKANDEMMIYTGIVCGKYKADANPERNAPLPPAKPKKK